VCEKGIICVRSRQSHVTSSGWHPGVGARTQWQRNLQVHGKESTRCRFPQCGVRDLVLNHPIPRVREMQTLLRSCHRDVQQPPFFLGVVRFFAGNDAIFKANDPNVWKLTALCGVHRQQLDSLIRRFGGLPATMESISEGSSHIA